MHSAFQQNPYASFGQGNGLAPAFQRAAGTTFQSQPSQLQSSSLSQDVFQRRGASSSFSLSNQMPISIQSTGTALKFTGGRKKGPQGDSPGYDATDQQILEYLTANREYFDPQIDLRSIKNRVMDIAGEATATVGQVQKDAEDGEESQKADDDDDAKEKRRSFTDVILKIVPLFKGFSEMQSAEARANNLLPVELSRRSFYYRWSPKRVWDQFTHIRWKDTLSFNPGKIMDAFKAGGNYVALKSLSLQGSAVIKSKQKQIAQILEREAKYRAIDDDYKAMIKEAGLFKKIMLMVERHFYVNVMGGLNQLKKYRDVLDNIPAYPYKEFKDAVADAQEAFKKEHGTELKINTKKPLGVGSIAQVYEATATVNGQEEKFAIKLIRPDATEDIFNQSTNYHYMREAVFHGWKTLEEAKQRGLNIEPQVMAYRSAMRQTELLKQEIQLQREAKNAAGIQETLNKYGITGIQLPGFIGESHRGEGSTRWNIQEFVEAPTLNKVKQSNPEQFEKDVRAIGTAMLRLMAVSQTIPLDPHYGNFTASTGDVGSTNYQAPYMLDHGRTIQMIQESGTAKKFETLRALLFQEAYAQGNQGGKYGHAPRVRVLNNDALKTALENMFQEPGQVTDDKLEQLVKDLTKPISIERPPSPDDSFIQKMGMIFSDGDEKTDGPSTNYFNFFLKYSDVVDQYRFDPDLPDLIPIFNTVVSAEDKEQVLVKGQGLFLPALIATDEQVRTLQAVETLIRDFHDEDNLFSETSRYPEASEILMDDLREMLRTLPKLHKSKKTLIKKALDNTLIDTNDSKQSLSDRLYGQVNLKKHTDFFTVFTKLPEAAQKTLLQFFAIQYRIVDVAQEIANDINTKNGELGLPKLDTDSPDFNKLVDQVLVELHSYVDLSPSRLFERE